jgi:hypothetical protein
MSGQRGVLMVAVAVYLLLFSMMAVTLAETGFLQLQMSGNSEAALLTRERAMALSDAVVEAVAESHVELGQLVGAGLKACGPGPSSSGCDIVLLQPRQAGGFSGAVEYYATIGKPPSRPIFLSEEHASSLRLYRYTSVEVVVQLGGVDGASQSRLGEGLLLRSTRHAL